jgi:hypothetical protein
MAGTADDDVGVDGDAQRLGSDAVEGETSVAYIATDDGDNDAGSNSDQWWRGA